MIMVEFRMRGSDLFNYDNHRIATLKGNKIFDADKKLLASVDEHTILDENSKVMATVEGDDVFNVSHKKIASIEQIRREIVDSTGGMYIVALWLLFVKKSASRKN